MKKSKQVTKPVQSWKWSLKIFHANFHDVFKSYYGGLLTHWIIIINLYLCRRGDTLCLLFLRRLQTSPAYLTEMKRSALRDVRFLREILFLSILCFVLLPFSNELKDELKNHSWRKWGRMITRYMVTAHYRRLMFFLYFVV